MSENDDRQNGRSRGTILLASRSPAFVQIVGDMIVDGGYELEMAMHAEPAWLSVARTRPVLVICDCRETEDDIGRLAADSVARRLPLLLLGTTDDQRSPPGDGHRSGIGCLRFPVTRDIFQSAIDELLTPPPAVGHQFVVSAAGVTIEGGFATRTLGDVRPPR